MPVAISSALLIKLGADCWVVNIRPPVMSCLFPGLGKRTLPYLARDKVRVVLRLICYSSG